MRKAVVIIPIVVWVILCLAEWFMWVKTPYAFFYSRGITKPNVSYHATTVGDLVAGNIFVTPVPRLCWYVTDRNGTRNESLPQEADILIFGDSFAWGAGNSHEDTPAVQLSHITGKKVVLASGSAGLRTAAGMHQAALLIKHQQPVPGKIFLYYILDGDLLEPAPWKSDPSEMVRDIFESSGTPSTYNWHEKFSNFKQYLRDYSPQAIIARKLKTEAEKASLSFLYHHNLVKRQSKTLDFVDHHGRVYGFIKTWPEIEQFNGNNQRLLETVKAFRTLRDEAKKMGVSFIPVIIPRKQIVYHQYIKDGLTIKGYGPGQILYDALNKEGVDSIFLHPSIFKAVREEMQEGKEAVYWNDDTHWSPYGIAIASKTIKSYLIQKGLL